MVPRVANRYARFVIRIFRAAVALTFVLLPFSPLFPASNEAENATLCDVVQRAKQFDHHQIRFEARVETVVLEGGTWLESDQCADAGIELIVPDEMRKHPENHPDYKQLDDAILGGPTIGTVNKRITAVFVGEFHRSRKRPHYTLVLSRVERVESIAVEKSPYRK